MRLIPHTRDLLAAARSRLRSALRLSEVLSATCLPLACSSATTVCSPIARFAVVAEVRDSVSQEPAAFGAVLILRDGNYADTVVGTDDGSDAHAAARLGAALERPGVYSAEISKAGYAVWSMIGIRVSRNTCGVEPVEVKARLIGL